MCADWISKMRNTLLQPWQHTCTTMVSDFAPIFCVWKYAPMYILTVYLTVSDIVPGQGSLVATPFFVSMSMCIGEFEYICEFTRTRSTNSLTNAFTYILIKYCKLVCMFVCIHIHDNAVNALSIFTYICLYVCTYAMLFASVFFNEFLFNAQIFTFIYYALKLLHDYNH